MHAPVIMLAAVLMGCPTQTWEPRPADAPYRMGFNMIRTEEAAPEFDSPDEVMADIVRVGGQGMRQIQDADLSWFSTWQGGDWDDPASYDFEATDAFVLNDHGLYPLPTLFQIGPATAARHFGESCPEEAASESTWCHQPHTPRGDVLDVRDPAVAAAVEGYVTVVGEHLVDSGVLHLEVLNEPARYRHADLGVDYTYTWGPKRYAELVELTAEALHAVDPDYQVVLGGMVFYDQHDADGRQEVWEDHLDKTLGHGAAEHVDVVSFHYYGDWRDLPGHIDEVRGVMEKHGIGEHPLWMTEAGSSAVDLGEVDQAADLVRTFSVALCNGVDLANWHTHLSSSDGDAAWAGFGTRTRLGRRHASWHTYEYYSHRFGNFGQCTTLEQGGGVWAYEFSGSHRADLEGIELGVVAWSEDHDATLDVSDLLGGAEVRVTVVVPDGEGQLTSWVQAADEPVKLGVIPVVVEPV